MLLGFDIGGTKCAAIVGKKVGNEHIILEKRVLPTNQPVLEMIESLFVAAETMLKKYTEDIEGIGIACGGPLDSKAGVILSPPNLPGWDNIAIVAIVEHRFGIKAILQNDANACAVAEWKYGAGVGCSNLIFLTFGTGMGAGLIINGKLYSGTNDFAGEVGHIRLAAPGGPVGYGKSGSFEGFCSGGGIAQLAQISAREQLQMGLPTSFCKHTDDLPLLNAKRVAEAAYNGDKVAIAVYKTCGMYLGKALALLIDILNPEVVIIGGIYVKAQSLIEPYMNEVLAQEALPAASRVCHIVPAKLADAIGDYASIAIANFE